MFCSCECDHGRRKHPLLNIDLTAQSFHIAPNVPRTCLVADMHPPDASMPPPPFVCTHLPGRVQALLLHAHSPQFNPLNQGAALGGPSATATFSAAEQDSPPLPIVPCLWLEGVTTTTCLAKRPITP